MDEITKAFRDAGLLTEDEAEALDQGTRSEAKPPADRTGDEPADDGITKAFRDAGLL
ncbi:hypothetical protein [Amycolatopsis sp. A1MSW2902]|uniref:hypothetical protein n=1 Tax=Amycolatopsis sp. A1MSW2902 TaxID=687413 RepID=UPI00307D4185